MTVLARWVLKSLRPRNTCSFLRLESRISQLAAESRQTSRARGRRELRAGPAGRPPAQVEDRRNRGQWQEPGRVFRAHRKAEERAEEHDPGPALLRERLLRRVERQGPGIEHLRQGRDAGVGVRRSGHDPAFEQIRAGQAEMVLQGVVESLRDERVAQVVEPEEQERG